MNSYIPNMSSKHNSDPDTFLEDFEKEISRMENAKDKTLFFDNYVDETLRLLDRSFDKLKTMKQKVRTRIRFDPNLGLSLNELKNGRITNLTITLNQSQLIESLKSERKNLGEEITKEKKQLGKIKDQINKKNLKLTKQTTDEAEEKDKDSTIKSLNKEITLTKSAHDNLQSKLNQTKKSLNEEKNNNKTIKEKARLTSADTDNSGDLKLSLLIKLQKNLMEEKLRNEITKLANEVTYLTDELLELREKSKNEIQKLKNEIAVLEDPVKQVGTLLDALKENVTEKYNNILDTNLGPVQVYCRLKDKITGEDFNDLGDQTQKAAEALRTKTYSWQTSENDNRSLIGENSKMEEDTVNFTRLFCDHNENNDPEGEGIWTEFKKSIKINKDKRKNTCITAYGSTGSGKSHTIKHLVPKILEWLYTHKDNKEISSTTEISMKCQQLYYVPQEVNEKKLEKYSVGAARQEYLNNENFKLLDLAEADPDKHSITINGEVYNIIELTTDFVENTEGKSFLKNTKESALQEANDYYEKTVRRRTTLKTVDNKDSSRSHVIVTITLPLPTLDNTGVENITITVIDLAGNEDITKAEKKLKELEKSDDEYRLGTKPGPQIDKDGIQGSGKLTGKVAKWSDLTDSGSVTRSGFNNISCDAENIEDGNALKVKTKVKYDIGKNGKAINISGGCNKTRVFCRTKEKKRFLTSPKLRRQIEEGYNINRTLTNVRNAFNKQKLHWKELSKKKNSNWNDYIQTIPRTDVKFPACNYIVHLILQHTINENKLIVLVLFDRSKKVEDITLTKRTRNFVEDVVSWKTNTIEPTKLEQAKYLLWYKIRLALVPITAENQESVRTYITETSDLLLRSNGATTETEWSPYEYGSSPLKSSQKKETNKEIKQKILDDFGQKITLS